MSRSPRIANMMTVVVSLVFAGVCLALGYGEDGTEAVILSVLAVVACVNALWAAGRDPK